MVDDPYRWLAAALLDAAPDGPVVARLVAEPDALSAAVHALDEMAALGPGGFGAEAVEQLEWWIESAVEALPAPDRQQRLDLLLGGTPGPVAAALLTPWAAQPADVAPLVERFVGADELLAAVDALDGLIDDLVIDPLMATAARARWLDALESRAEHALADLDGDALAALRAVGPRSAALLTVALADRSQLATASAANPTPSDALVEPFVSETVAPVVPLLPAEPSPRSRRRWPVWPVVAAVAAALILVVLRPGPPGPVDPPPIGAPSVDLRPMLPRWVGPLVPEPPAIVPPSRVRPALVPVPAGRFVMGSPEDEAGREPDEVQRSVTLTRSVMMARTEVTQGQWAALMGTRPARFGPDQGGSRDHPVEQVSWFDAVAYANALSQHEGRPACYALVDCAGTPGDGAFACARVERAGPTCVGYRLPTEAEWEHAARAGTTTATWAGPLVLRDVRDAPVLEVIAWYAGNSGVERGGMDCTTLEGRADPAARCGTHPVGLKRANPWGLHDMIGNVWEWTDDWYGTRSSDSAVDPVGPSAGARKVTKGCGWFRDARFCRAANRYRPRPDYRSSVVGFRVVRAADDG